MFVCAGGESMDAYRIHLRTSEDAVTWTRHPANPLLVDGYEARDPMVLRVGDRWVMYYTATSTPTGGHFVVAAVESDDLVHWHGRRDGLPRRLRRGPSAAAPSHRSWSSATAAGTCSSGPTGRGCSTLSIGRTTGRYVPGVVPTQPGAGERRPVRVRRRRRGRSDRRPRRRGRRRRRRRHVGEPLRLGQGGVFLARLHVDEQPGSGRGIGGPVLGSDGEEPRRDAGAPQVGWAAAAGRGDATDAAHRDRFAGGSDGADPSGLARSCRGAPGPRAAQRQPGEHEAEAQQRPREEARSSGVGAGRREPRRSGSVVGVVAVGGRVVVGPERWWCWWSGRAAVVEVVVGSLARGDQPDRGVVPGRAGAAVVVADRHGDHVGLGGPGGARELPGEGARTTSAGASTLPTNWPQVLDVRSDRSPYTSSSIAVTVTGSKLVLVITSPNGEQPAGGGPHLRQGRLVTVTVGGTSVSDTTASSVSVTAVPAPSTAVTVTTSVCVAPALPVSERRERAGVRVARTERSVPTRLGARALRGDVAVHVVDAGP